MLEPEANVGAESKKSNQPCLTLTRPGEQSEDALMVYAEVGEVRDC